MPRSLLHPRREPARGAVIAAVVAAALAFPAAGQDAPPPDDRPPPGPMEEGARTFLRGLLSELGPAIEGMGEALDEIGPALDHIAAMIDDLANYEAPVLLPNGDILIRRRPGAPPPAGRSDPQPLPEPGPGGEIEL